MMKRSSVVFAVITALCIGVCLPQTLPAAESKDFAHVQAELQQILSDLAENLDHFEEIQRKLDQSGRTKRNYDEQKNVWISTILAITAISSICEFENDLLSLFLDLKPHRRPYFYDVRIQSLEISIRQIRIMQEQIRISHSLLSPDTAENQLLERVNRAIAESIRLLDRSLTLIQSLKTGK